MELSTDDDNDGEAGVSLNEEEDDDSLYPDAVTPPSMTQCQAGCASNSSRNPGGIIPLTIHQSTLYSCQTLSSQTCP